MPCCRKMPYHNDWNLQVDEPNMKYEIGTSEGEFEPESDGKVLRNRLGISSEIEMNEAEEVLLIKLYEWVFSQEFSVKTLSFQDIREWHRKWLGLIYEWAGKLRTVDMAKGDFRFAAAQFLQQQIPPFEQAYLSRYPGLPAMEIEDLVSFLA